MYWRIKRILDFLGFFGIDLYKMGYAFSGLILFLRDYRELSKQRKFFGSQFPFARIYPCLDDKFAKSGIARGHYFHQDLLVAKKIFANKPELHVDIGSRIDGFVAHVASFREIEVFDIRDLDSQVSNIKFTCLDLMGQINPSFFEYCDSLSSLHAIEHFGLGRYGDPIKYDGYMLGLNNIYNILKKNGTFYFSVPIGPQRTEFNAHRVFSLEYLMAIFSEKYLIKSFSYVDDNGNLNENIAIAHENLTNNFGCQYGCGIFEMTKL